MKVTSTANTSKIAFIESKSPFSGAGSIPSVVRGLLIFSVFVGVVYSIAYGSDSEFLDSIPIDDRNLIWASFVSTTVLAISMMVSPRTQKYAVYLLILLLSTVVLDGLAMNKVFSADGVSEDSAYTMAKVFTTTSVVACILAITVFIINMLN